MSDYTFLKYYENVHCWKTAFKTTKKKYLHAKGQDRTLISKMILRKRKKTKDPVKVHIFWEGHKILRNLNLTFDYGTYNQK